MFTTGGRRGACAFFFLTESEEQVRESFLSFALSFSLSLSFSFSLLCFLTSSRQPDRNQSCRTFIRSGRCKMCFDVSAPILPRVLLRLACVYLLSCESRRCKLVNASTAVWCSSRLMSSRRVHASVTLTASGTAVSASPMSLPSLLSFSFNRLLRIFFLRSSGYRFRENVYLCAALAARPH